MQHLSHNSKNLSSEVDQLINHTAKLAGNAADHLLQNCFPTANIDIREVAHALQYALDITSLRLAIPNFQSSSVTFFGSSREVDSTTRESVRKLSADAARLGFSIGTGGGPNIMSDANQGAYEVSDKLSWAVPHGNLDGEPPNPFFDLAMGITMCDFPQRVEGLSYDALTSAYIVNKGGFGTLEERCQIASFMKEGTISEKPIFAYDQGGYWSEINPELDALMFNDIKRETFQRFTYTTGSTAEILSKLEKLDIFKPQEREGFSYEDLETRGVESLSKPYERVEYQNTEHNNDPVWDFIVPIVNQRLRENPNIANLQIGHSNTFIKLFLDSLSSYAAKNVFARDKEDFAKNVTLFGSQETKIFEDSQEIALSHGLNVISRHRRSACKFAHGKNPGEYKRWQGLRLVTQHGNEIENPRLTFRRRTSSASTALRLSSKALFLPGGISTLKLAMKALCWTQTKQMHPKGSGRDFTPIFVGEPWANIDSKGKVTGPMANILRTLVTNNCIAPDHVKIPQFAKNTKEALEGKLYSVEL